MNKFEIKVGQVWQDNDIRRQGRTLKIKSIDGENAYCEVLTHQSGLKQEKKLVRVKMARFLPRANGYSLIPPLFLDENDFKQLIDINSSLCDKCHELMNSRSRENWISIINNVAEFHSGRCSIIVRQFDTGFDIKGLIEGSVIYSEILDKLDLNRLISSFVEIYNDMYQMFTFKEQLLVHRED